MYKNIITTCLILFASVQLWGQSDCYSDLSETLGHIVKIYDVDKLYGGDKLFIYKMNEKGKLVKEKAPQVYKQINNQLLRAVDIVEVKKKSYWVVECQEEKFYLLIEDIDYCKNIMSFSYWEQEYQVCSEKHTHYIYKNSNKDDLASYLPIQWLGFEMPRRLKELPTFKFNTVQTKDTIVSPFEVNRDNGFISEGEYIKIKADIEERIRLEAEQKRIEQERKDSIADYSRIIHVKVLHGSSTYGAFKDNGVFADAPKFEHVSTLLPWYKPSKYTKYCMAKEWDYYMTIYKFNPFDDTFVGFCKGKEITLPRTVISGLKSEDEQFLIRRFATGNRGEEIRKATAMEYDRLFYSSADEHMKIISSLEPEKGTYSKDERIGNNYVLKYDVLAGGEFYMLSTGKSITNKYAGQVFTLIDIVDDPTINSMLTYTDDDVILYNSKFGYCYTSTVNFKLNFVEQKTAIKNQQKRKEWENRMIEKYGETNGKLIIAGKVRVGFTSEMCRDSWGKPSDINRTTTAYGVHEQWVYGYGNYLYFEDGILTTIQN